MVDRAELLESAMEGLVDGLVLVDQDGRIAFWNRAAETITGYSTAESIGRAVHEVLDKVIVGGKQQWIGLTDSESSSRQGFVVQIRHKLDQDFPVFARTLVLRDAMGERIGSGVIFHATERLDALPRGQLSDNSSAAESRSALEERLRAMHEEFCSGAAPFSVIWMTVDQARELRGTHGGRAVEAMLEKMERTLSGGLKPAEEIGRWGDDEFLILSHERNSALLAARAKVLSVMAATTDFRWWGDRISLTVSAGAAWAEEGESLKDVLGRAQEAMFESMHEGGNQAAASPRRSTCSRS